MSLTKEGYRLRLIDERIERYLRIFGAVLIEGPKWCGKTWTSLNHANSVAYVTEKSVRNNAMVDPKYIFLKDRPQLIDEWRLFLKYGMQSETNVTVIMKKVNSSLQDLHRCKKNVVRRKLITPVLEGLPQ